jgi:hypothetical protein
MLAADIGLIAVGSIPAGAFFQCAKFQRFLGNLPPPIALVSLLSILGLQTFRFLDGKKAKRQTLEEKLPLCGQV